MNKIKYAKNPLNDNSEVHVCFRVSDAYTKYILIPIYSILFNNMKSYVYMYIFTDHISVDNWKKITDVCNKFENNEIIKVIPSNDDLKTMQDISQSKLAAHHGWSLVPISVFYQKYLNDVKKVFNFGVDAFCVGDLNNILLADSGNAHYSGTSSSHQKNKSLISLSPTWIGFDTALLNLELMRADKISPERLIDYSVSNIGYINDEVAHNGACSRQLINFNYYYIYTGSYLPRKHMNKETVVVDFYSKIKPWDIAVRGFEVFELYIDYYKSVNQIVALDFELPISLYKASESLKNKGMPFIDWFPIRHPIIGKWIYNIYWSIKKIFAFKKK
jgi:lipopolysaccharide biosynthesis glycosyltransferase